MFKITRFSLTMIVASLAVAVSALAKNEKPASLGSVHVAGKVKEADLPALAKIDLATALQAALTALPGRAIMAELEVDEGSLIYSFEIVGADKTISEVCIDAGNGKVLAIEKDADDHDDEKKDAKHGDKKKSHHDDDDGDDKKKD